MEMIFASDAPDMALPDQNSGMMDALREAKLEYLRLQATF